MPAFENGESGLSVRNKINTAIEQIEAFENSNLTYATTTLFEDAVAAGLTADNGTTAFAEAVKYIAESGNTSIATLPGWRYADAEVKAQYERNSNTNAFTDTEQSKLSGIESGATADQTNTEIAAAYSAEVPQVTPTERTNGTETAVRRYSPADIASMAGTHGGGGGSLLNPIPDDYATNTTPGTTDMTVAFQTALDTGGAVDLMPDTIYAVSSLDAVTGNRINLNGSTVFQIGSSTGPVINLVAVDDFALFNGTIDGNKGDQTNDGNFGLQSGTTLSNRVRIDGVHFKDCFSGSLKLNYCDDLMVTNCSFRNGGAASSASRNEVAVGLSASVSIIGNNFYGALLTGADNVACIIDTSGGNAVISGNHFENYESEVIQVVRFNAGGEDTGVNRIDRCVISNNIINGSNGAAPYCIQVGENCQNVIVTSNVCYGAAEGIRIGQYVRDVVVSDNICTGNSGSGITVLGKTYGKLIISNNKCDDNDTNGISIDGDYADTIEVLQVIGNMCTNNCQDTASIRGGIRISASITTGLFANNVCTDNQSVKTQAYGLVLQGGTWENVVISGNNLMGNLTASSYINVGRDNFTAYGNEEDTTSIDDLTIASTGAISTRGYLTVAGGMSVAGYTDFNGTVDLNGNSIVAADRITLTPQSDDPGGTTGAFANAQAGISGGGRNFGNGGAGMYWLSPSNLWSKLD